MLYDRLSELGLPEYRSREEAIRLLLSEQYGFLPPMPDEISFDVQRGNIRNFCAGKASLIRVNINCIISGRSFSFPFWSMIPNDEKKYPFFVMLGFDRNVPNKYLPAEEILDNGFAVLYLCYEDVTSDDGDFENGLSGVLYGNGERGDADAGKIAMWAWAAQRVMDYAETLDSLDKDNSIVCGHSRLGKTALLAGATDERFRFSYSNDSGCSGAAITRGKRGENVEKVTDSFPYWFCKNYTKYRGRESEMPFEQHFLISAIAPRYAYVASAEADIWADPCAEFLSCVAATEEYKKQGLRGLVCEDRLPICPEYFHNGEIGYHIRRGLHYFSREDWRIFIEYFRLHRKVAVSCKGE